MTDAETIDDADLRRLAAEAPIPITTQSGIDGYVGAPVAVILSEATAEEAEEGFFDGLGDLVRGRTQYRRPAADRAMAALLDILSGKARARGGDAIVAASFSLTRGTNDRGVRRVRLTGVGTVVAAARTPPTD